MTLPIMTHVSDEVDSELSLMTINSRLLSHWAHLAGLYQTPGKARAEAPGAFPAASSMSPPRLAGSLGSCCSCSPCWSSHQPPPWLLLSGLRTGNCRIPRTPHFLLAPSQAAPLLARVSVCLAFPLGRLNCRFPSRGRQSVSERSILTAGGAPVEVQTARKQVTPLYMKIFHSLCQGPILFTLCLFTRDTHTGVQWALEAGICTKHWNAQQSLEGSEQ